MMCSSCSVPEGTLRKRDNTDTASSASMPHSQILASMAWIRCHAKAPRCVYVHVSLFRFYAPLTMGRPPAVPYILITAGNNTSLFMWQEYYRVRATTRVAVGVYDCDFMFRSCYGLVTACQWALSHSPPNKIKQMKPSLSLQPLRCTVKARAVSWMAAGHGLWKARPCTLTFSSSRCCTPDCAQKQRHYQTSTLWQPGQRSCH